MTVRPPAPRPSPLVRFAQSTGVDTRIFAMLGALGVIWVGFDALSGGAFLTPRNLWNLAVQSSVVGIMACGMVFVIVTRHIDLSVGSIAGMTGMIIAYYQVEVFPAAAAWNPWVTLAMGLAVGAAIGAFQGYWTAYLGVPAFIVTLAGLLIFRGGAWLITEGRTVAPMHPTFQLLGGGFEGSIGAFWSWVAGAVAIAAIIWLTWQARRRSLHYGFAVRPLGIEVGLIAVRIAMVLAFVQVMNSYYRPRTQIPQGIPIPVLTLILVAIAMEVIARTRRFGRYVYAIGGNPEAARLAGVPTRTVTVQVFAVMGLLAALAGAVATARLNAGANSTGELAELSVIAAAVIGGTSLAGGVGTVGGALLGAVITQSLENGMVLIGLSSALKNVVIGVVLMAAVWLDTAFQQRRG